MNGPCFIWKELLEMRKGDTKDIYGPGFKPENLTPQP